VGDDVNAAAYRTRAIDVTAIRWTGEDNCEEVFAFLGLGEHPDDELDHSQILGIGDSQTANHGDWIVRHGDGEDDVEVYTDEAFRAKYEAAPSLPERPMLREVTQWFLVGDDSGIPGDCMRAAVASLLDRDPASVPHFIVGSDMDSRIWWYALKGWAHSNGWNVTRRGLLPRQENVPLPTFGIACGPSERGVSHAVVVVDGKIAWDPHPSRAGILRVKEAIEFEAVSALEACDE
jgi:hypothetical protein